MRLTAALILLAAPALADDCHDRTLAQILRPVTDEPLEAHIVADVEGMPMENTYSQASSRHYLVVSLKPPGPRVLTKDGVTWQEDGDGWTRLYEVDPDKAAADARAKLEAQAATLTDARCRTATLDGRTLDVFEGTMTEAEPPTEIRFAYWAEPDTGFVVRAETTMLLGSEVIQFTQTIRRAPGLELPSP